MNQELEQLRTEVEQLRQNVRGLESMRISRFNRWLPLFAGMAIGVLVAQLPRGEAQAVAQDEKELVCKSLRVVGAGGKNMLTLGSDKDGGQLALFGADGKLRGELFVADKQGYGSFNLFDSKKTRILYLGADEDGGILEIYGLDAKIRTIVAVAPKQGGGLINLFDTKKKLRLVLEGSDLGAVIEKQ